MKTHVLVAVISVLPAFAQHKVDFQTDVAPIFEQYCVNCHHAGNTKADLEMSSRKDLLDHRAITPGKPDQSVLYTMMQKGLMPPGKRLPDDKLTIVRDWIAQGAAWPDNVKLAARKPASLDS